MSNGDDLAKGGLFSTIEKATDFNFLLQCIAFVLFLDSVFLRLHGTGVLDFVQNAAKLDRSIALEVSLLFLAFSMCVTVVLPFAGGILDAVYIQYVSWLVNGLMQIVRGGAKENVRFQRKHNCVLPAELREAAHEQQSSFMLGLYDKRSTQNFDDHRASVRSGFNAFCVLAMLGANYWFAATDATSSMTRRIAEYCHSTAPIWVALTLLVILTYRRFHEDDRGNDWIYHPPLYKTLEQQDAERLAKAEEFERKFMRERELANETENDEFFEL